MSHLSACISSILVIYSVSSLSLRRCGKFPIRSCINKHLTYSDRGFTDHLVYISIVASSVKCDHCSCKCVDSKTAVYNNTDLNNVMIMFTMQLRNNEMFSIRCNVNPYPVRASRPVGATKHNKFISHESHSKTKL